MTTDTYYKAVRVTDEVLSEMAGWRRVVRQMLVRVIRMHTTEPIHFSVVPFRTDDNEGGLEFRALAGPKAAKYVQNAREARKWGFRLG